MKARINREKVLLYRLGAETEKGARIQKLLKEIGVQAVELDKTALGQTLGCLAGLPGYPREDAEPPATVPEQELMAFSGFSDSRLNAFLRAYREALIPPVHLKAVVTPHNRDWRLCDLFGELEKEHAFFQKYQELQQLIAQAEEQMKSASDERAARLKGLIAKGKAFRLEEDPAPAELDRLVLALREAVI